MLKRALKKIFLKIGVTVQRNGPQQFADPETLGKAQNPKERFREVLSDPLNLAIAKVPSAGFVDKSGYVTLHNGNKVPVSGDLSYYGDFSDLLIYNQGVHEPLEEYCFQRLIASLPTDTPRMLELGAYWAHYSMWLKKVYPNASVTMVEPEMQNLAAGEANFRTNGFAGRFINDLVGKGYFEVDTFLAETSDGHLTILHSDIQGFELEMLEGAATALREVRIDYIFISTHGEDVHRRCTELLQAVGYRIEIDSEPLEHTTSHDGFIFASSPKMVPIFEGFAPLGRVEIQRATPLQLVTYLKGAVI